MTIPAWRSCCPTFSVFWSIPTSARKLSVSALPLLRTWSVRCCVGSTLNHLRSYMLPRSSCRVIRPNQRRGITSISTLGLGGKVSPPAWSASFKLGPSYLRSTLLSSSSVKGWSSSSLGFLTLSSTTETASAWSTLVCLSGSMTPILSRNDPLFSCRVDRRQKGTRCLITKKAEHIRTWGIGLFLTRRRRTVIRNKAPKMVRLETRTIQNTHVGDGEDVTRRLGQTNPWRCVPRTGESGVWLGATRGLAAFGT